METNTAYKSIFEKITKNTIIVTPNRRLSANLRLAYCDYKAKNNSMAWESPLFLPFHNFTTLLWDIVCTHYSLSINLVSAQQEQYLWQYILNKAAKNDDIDNTAFLSIAKSARTLIKEWDVDINSPFFSYSEDYQTYLKWHHLFEKELLKRNLIDHSHLINVIIQYFNFRSIKQYTHIIFTGFTEFNPQQKRLIDILKKTINHVDEISPTVILRDKVKTSFKNQDDEVLYAAQFCKEILEANPASTIGCVLPNIEARRDRIIQLFEYVFKENVNDYINISAGKPLLSHPIINIIFELLLIPKATITLDTLEKVITSPFIGESITEGTQRAYWIDQLKNKNIHSVSLDTIERIDHYLGSASSCKHLKRRLKSFIERTNKINSKLRPSEWISEIVDHLSILGWPGEVSLDSREYQIVETWLSLLESFKSLDYVADQLSYSQIHHMLKQACTNTVFQAKSPNAPIQLLGLLEAAGQSFDYLWIGGIDDDSWPPKPKPNPFIPRQIQRNLQMPHSTATREYRFSKHILEQLSNHSRMVIYSYSESNVNEQFTESKMINSVKGVDYLSLVNTPPKPPHQIIYDTKQLDWISDYTATPILEKQKCQSGVTIIKNQSLCPFKAFAESRLQARKYDEPTLGISKKDKGHIVHEILELFWKQVQSQHTLLTMSDYEIAKAIENVTHQAFSAIQHSNTSFKNHTLIEIDRIQKLTYEWIILEKARDPFVVKELESEKQVTIDNLVFDVRIDRIDSLENNEEYIIDYKTGKYNEISSWLGDRPEEPQLPIYATFCASNPSGIMFAQVAPGNICIKGLAKHATAIKGIKTLPELKYAESLSWDLQVTSWRNTILRLAKDFESGLASVNPKHPIETCGRCHLQPLCRISEEQSHVQ